MLLTVQTTTGHSTPKLVENIHLDVEIRLRLVILCMYAKQELT